MISGTSNFVSKAAAAKYYAVYGENMQDVEHKIAHGYIEIGKPVIKAGQSLVIIDDGTRYAIETKE